MDKEELKGLARDRDFISGVYNYCDRWCERCPLTSRCMTFAMGEEAPADPQSHDDENRVFWGNLNEIFQATLDLLKEMAEEQGVDLEVLGEKETEEERLTAEVARSHVCCRGAEAYSDLVDGWFKSVSELFGGAEGVRGVEDRSEGNFEEAVEVIRWYQHLIAAKLVRAVRGVLLEREEEPAEFPKDSDGSAKVALIAVDRSLAAWGTIRNLLPFRTDEIVKILVHLKGLRERVEKAFPHARAFIRPGFDKIDLNS